MATGCYNITHNEEKTEIEFEIISGLAGDIPEDQLSLAIEIEGALDIIRYLYKDDRKPEFNRAFDQLFGIAKTGLEGDISSRLVQPVMAIRALKQFKKEIEDREGGRVKNDYLKKLGIRAVIAGVPMLIIGSFFNYYVYCSIVSCDCIQLGAIGNMLILLGGTMTGVWLSFAITRTYIVFEDLAIPEKDKLEPTIRLVFTGILSVVFGLLFIKKSIEIKLGDLSSYDVVKDPITAYLLGVILGINEKIIGSTLTKKTTDLIK